MRENEQLMEAAKNVVRDTLDHCSQKKYHRLDKDQDGDPGRPGRFIWKKMKRSPMILPIIMEV